MISEERICKTCRHWGNGVLPYWLEDIFDDNSIYKPYGLVLRGLMAYATNDYYTITLAGCAALKEWQDAQK